MQGDKVQQPLGDFALLPSASLIKSYDPGLKNLCPHLSAIATEILFWDSGALFAHECCLDCDRRLPKKSVPPLRISLALFPNFLSLRYLVGVNDDYINGLRLQYFAVIKQELERIIAVEGVPQDYPYTKDSCAGLINILMPHAKPAVDAVVSLVRKDNK